MVTKNWISILDVVVDLNQFVGLSVESAKNRNGDQIDRIVFHMSTGAEIKTCFTEHIIKVQQSLNLELKQHLQIKHITY